MKPAIHSEPIRRAELLALLGILALAALLRLGWPGIQEFKRDEAALLSLSLGMVERGEIPLRGIGSSIGLPNAPIGAYLFALPMLAPWNRNPVQAGLFAGELGVMAVCLCWLMARRYFGPHAALIAALLFAANPWAVVYARKVWAQDLLPLFVLAWAATGLLALSEGRRRWIAPHLLLLALLPQIHLSAVALAPVTLLGIIVYWRRVDFRWLSAGVVAGAVTALPYGLYTLEHAAGALEGAGTVAARPAEWSAQSIQYAWMLAIGSTVHSLAGPTAFRDFLDSASALAWTPWAAGLLIGLGMAFWVVRRRRGLGARDLFLGAWIVVPILFFLRHSTPVFPHYFILLYPAPFVLAGDGLSRLVTHWPQALSRIRLAIGVIGLAIGQAALLVTLGQFLSGKATPGGFGTPVGRLSRVAEAAQAEMAEAEEIVVVGPGDSPEHDEIPSVMSVLLRDLPVRFVDGDEASVWPARPAVVVVWSGTESADRGYEGWGEAHASIPLREGEGAVEIRRVAGTPGPPIGETIASPRLFANGVELLAYEWQGAFQPGGTGEWRVTWRAPSPDADYHFFNHLLAGDGTKIVGVDGEGMSANAWREGDRVTSYFAFPLPDALPPPPYRMRVGMYEYPATINVPVLDQAGNPFADAVTLGPLR